VDGSQPDVPRACTVFAGTFQVIEEQAKEWSIEVFDLDLGWLHAKPFLGKLQKQAEAIAISRHGMRAGLALALQTIGEEGLKKRRKASRNHDRTSFGVSRSVAS
jgi:hypothetical protein